MVVKNNLKNVSPFIPTKIKSRIDSMFFTTVPFEKFHIDEQERLKLLRKYYSENIKKIKELTDDKFSYWLENKSV